MDAVQSRRGKGLHLGKKVILILGYIFRNHSNFTVRKKDCLHSGSLFKPIFFLPYITGIISSNLSCKNLRFPVVRSCVCI